MARFGCIVLCALISAILIFLPGCTNIKKQGAWTASTVKVHVGGGHGSGVQIHPGYFLTAAHVARHGDMTVETQDGQKRPAELLWMSPTYDVAMLRVVGLKVPVTPLECSAAVVGQKIKAVGNPGPYNFAHTWGRISAKAEERFRWKSAILVDVAAGPGSSGGPVFNMRGSVVGLVVGYHEDIPGVMIVVPSSTVCELLARPRNS